MDRTAHIAKNLSAGSSRLENIMIPVIQSTWLTVLWRDGHLGTVGMPVTPERPQANDAHMRSFEPRNDRSPPSGIHFSMTMMRWRNTKDDGATDPCDVRGISSRHFGFRSKLFGKHGRIPNMYMEHVRHIRIRKQANFPTSPSTEVETRGENGYMEPILQS